MAALSVVSVGNHNPERLRLRLGPLKQHNNEKKMMKMRVKAKGEGGAGMAKYKGTQMREKKLTEMIEKKVIEANQVCEGENKYSDECKVAWDEVEEVSQAKADLRRKLEKQDPLESFCHDHPDTEECLIYED